MDSAMQLVDKALSFDPQLSEAHVLRGQYYYIDGQIDASIDALNNALSLNPNDWTAYRALGAIYSQNDLIRSIQNLNKAVSLNKEPEVLPDLLRLLSDVYGNGGFPDKRDTYRLEAFKLDKDSVKFYNALMIAESLSLNYEDAIEYGTKALAIDSSNSVTLEYLGDTYSNLGDWENALYYRTRYLQRLKDEGALRINDMHRVAHIYFLNGMEEEADAYFDLQLEYCTQDIELNRPQATKKYSFYDLAGIYAFRGEEEKALDNLRVFNQRRMMPSFMVYFIKWDPLFETLRDNPEFQQIVLDVEAKYQAEHERVRQWLEENDML
jgi:tetratricopeptide (TPR) repeat protein